ncbi:ABC transporter permease [Steroidobacter denitrificans]|uniref:ABC transporter permease n=1 Tax=Steroidobacter denitrificans TaxID=465721 RepID=A0A127FAD9_STEDE|nr:ABC transporter permease [Steroidobacter denitrificans]
MRIAARRFSFPPRPACRLIQVLGASLALSLSLTAQAHKAWMLPSATVTTPGQWITVDAAVSNDLFYFNHVPLRLDSLIVTAPDGSRLTPENPSTGKYRSVFDLHLPQNGTYKLAMVNRGLFAGYEVDGVQKRWRGTAERFAAEIPANAANLQVSEAHSRLETFVTAGAPTKQVFTTTGLGLELVPITHPNDLYAGETAIFSFLIDGRAAADLEVSVVPDGTRYRDQQEEMTLRTNAKGELSITWPRPGMYWLETSLQDDKTSIAQAQRRRLGYVATFEVLPQ